MAVKKPVANAATVAVIQDALKSCGLPVGAVQAIDNLTVRWSVKCCVWINFIDMLIRVVAGLHKAVPRTVDDPE